VEHEALPHLAVDHLDLLLVVGGAERDGDERLGLAAGEGARSARPRRTSAVSRRPRSRIPPALSLSSLKITWLEAPLTFLGSEATSSSAEPIDAIVVSSLS
jgi:hypothetical protein